MGIEDPDEDVLEQSLPAVLDAEDDDLDVLSDVPIETDPADVAEDLGDVVVAVPAETPLEADPADVAEQLRAEPIEEPELED